MTTIAGGDDSLDTLLSELLELIDKNGTVPRETKDKLTLKVLAEVLRQLKGRKQLAERVEELEKKNLITIYEKHPKTAILVTFMVFVVMNYFAHAITPEQWFGALAKMLGIP